MLYLATRLHVLLADPFSLDIVARWQILYLPKLTPQLVVPGSIIALVPGLFGIKPVFSANDVAVGLYWAWQCALDPPIGITTCLPFASQVI